jgi:hypothetical protein
MFCLTDKSGWNKTYRPIKWTLANRTQAITRHDNKAYSIGQQQQMFTTERWKKQ